MGWAAMDYADNFTSSTPADQGSRDDVRIIQLSAESSHILFARRWTVFCADMERKRRSRLDFR